MDEFAGRWSGDFVRFNVLVRAHSLQPQSQPSLSCMLNRSGNSAYVTGSLALPFAYLVLPGVVDVHEYVGPS